VVGAGSFTGIRIGVATVKAMCFAFNKPCLSITSFDTIAYNSQGGKVLAVIDAKHNGFYVCGYDGRAISVEPSYVMRESLTEYVSEYELLSFEPIKDLPVTVVSIAKGLEKAISEKANEISSDLETLSPLYVRKSQAEEGRK
jgi:tRNA A37 threonylcarbamoyladenosine modification protein TsaB